MRKCFCDRCGLEVGHPQAGILENVEKFIVTAQIVNRAGGPAPDLCRYCVLVLLAMAIGAMPPKKPSDVLKAEAPRLDVKG